MSVLKLSYAFIDEEGGLSPATDLVLVGCGYFCCVNRGPSSLAWVCFWRCGGGILNHAGTQLNQVPNCQYVFPMCSKPAANGISLLDRGELPVFDAPGGSSTLG